MALACDTRRSTSFGIVIKSGTPRKHKPQATTNTRTRMARISCCTRLVPLSVSYHRTAVLAIAKKASALLNIFCPCPISVLSSRPSGDESRRKELEDACKSPTCTPSHTGRSILENQLAVQTTHIFHATQKDPPQLLPCVPLHAPSCGVE